MDAASPAPPRDSERDDRRDWRTVFPFLVGVTLCGLLALLNDIRDFGLWRNYALTGLFIGSVGTWIFWQLDVRVPHYIQWFIVLAVMLHYGGGSTGGPTHDAPGFLGMHGINGAYHVFGWWDNLTHIAGTAAAGMGAVYLLEVFQLRRRLGWHAGMVFGLAWLVALTVGVGVELYEFGGKTLFQTIDQGGYFNTMGDLVSNLAGATLGVGVAVAVNRRVQWQRIQAQWGEHAAPVQRWRALPPSMMGLIAFVAPPAAVALFLAIRFIIQDPVETMAAYDHALIILTRGAMTGVVLGPLAAIVGNEVHRRAPALAEVSAEAPGEGPR